jgi:antitoxin ParD1/3/4
MSVDAEPDQRRFLSELVRSGRYKSETEVLQDGVRVLQERETELAELEARLMRGLADAEAGQMRDMDEVFDEIEAELLAMSDVPD